LKAKAAGISLLLFIISLFSIYWWIRHDLATPYYSGTETQTFVEIPKGASPRQMADLLTDAGVMKHRLPFILYLRWTGEGRKLQAGEYRFSEPATPPDIIQRLIRGDVFFNSITIPEGLTALETISLIAQNGLAKSAELERLLSRTSWIEDYDKGAASLEGYLFPETYRFSRKAGAEQILRAMVDQFKEKARKLLASQPLPQGWDLRKVVILASMVEKEVKSRAERPLVASVLKNRLEKGIPLACDPTIIYALKASGKFDGNIRKADLSMDSPYNTYIRPGLPPGPIANPGFDSLKAAMKPAETEYFYFVSRNDGTHQFSKDYKTHQSAVTHFQKRRAASSR
jgi:UPF0755 protein